MSVWGLEAGALCLAFILLLGTYEMVAKSAKLLWIWLKLPENIR